MEGDEGLEEGPEGNVEDEEEEDEEEVACI